MAVGTRAGSPPGHRSQLPAFSYHVRNGILSTSRKRRWSTNSTARIPHIVFLDATHLSLAPFPFEHTLDVYEDTPPSKVVERIRTATIVISVLVPLRSTDLDSALCLELIAVLANGCSWIDKSYCVSRNISVVNVPNASIEAVGEQFLALYFACRRRLPAVSDWVKRTDQWIKSKTLTRYIWNGIPPLSCREEVLGIIGYGQLGQRIENLARSLEFSQILIAERKGAGPIRKGRVAFEEVLRQSTIVLLSCPFSTEGMDMIGETELQKMRSDSVLINIARGGLINEEALADALRRSQIYGAALDVLWKEPGGPGTSPLLPNLDAGEAEVPNLTVTGHTAYFAGCTVQEMQRNNRDALCAFVHGTLSSDLELRSSVVVHDGKIWK